MCDADNLNKDRSTPHWHVYRRECFIGGANHGVNPPFNTDPEQLEALAKQKLSQEGWYYVSSNAGIGLSTLANRQALYRRRIVPRMLVDTQTRETATELFGHKISAPFGFAPVGINVLYNPEGEKPVARVAEELNLPYCLSSAGSTSIEKVGAANGKGPRFFQLYLTHDDELTVSLMTRAWNSGFDVLILTCDTWQLGWRHDDVSIANYSLYQGTGGEMGLTDPVFQKRLKEAGIDPNKDRESYKFACQKWIDNIWHGRAHSWDKIPWLMGEWKRISNGRPFVIKGILDVRDARKCVDIGCDGIVVSNHAGRQIDGEIASLDALEEIVDVVGDKLTVMVDSGFRTASDIMKALAIGAKCVLLGHLWIWGLSVYGEVGVRHVMKSLLAEFDLNMCVGGFTSIADITKDSIRTYASEGLTGRGSAGSIF